MAEFDTKELIGSPRTSARLIHPPIIGTSSSTSEEFMNIDVRSFADSQFIISNTGAHSLHYDVFVYNNYNIGLPFNVFSNDIAGNDSDEVILTRHAKVTVKVNSITTTDTTFQIDGIAGRG